VLVRVEYERREVVYSSVGRGGGSVRGKRGGCIACRGGALHVVAALHENEVTPVLLYRPL